MKAYTDLEQSKKLAEILPIESADMYYDVDSYGVRTIPEVLITSVVRKKDVPCWSLAALLSVLPQSVRLVGTPKDTYWYCECVDSNNQWYAGFGSADNPVDACYEMIIKLNEQKIL